MVHGLARRIVRDDSAAEEVTIEVYSQACRQASRYDPARGSPSARLLTMTRSRALSPVRRDSLRAMRETPLEPSSNLPAPTAGPDDFSMASETRRGVLKALAALSSDQRLAIELAYYLGLSHREIATRLGQPLGTVKTHIRRGMMLLREHQGDWATTSAGPLVKRLLRDPIARRATSLVRMRGGTIYPSHRHVDTEELYILEGEFDVHGPRLRPGDYCASVGGSVHRSASTPDGCQFLVSASEDDELLASDEPARHGLLLVPDGQGAWGQPASTVAVRPVAIDSHFGVATILVRMAPGSRYPVSGQQIYLLDGEVRLADHQGLGAGDFCGTVTGTIEVAESAPGCLLLVLSARGAIAEEGTP